MKKGLLFVFLILIVFCLTGCGKKETLLCSKKDSTGSIDLTFKYSGKLKSMSMYSNIDLSNYPDNVIDTISAKDYCSTYHSLLENFAFVGCKQSLENKHIITTTKIDVKKIKSKKVTDSSKESKKYFEKKGYTCTINQ